MRINYSNKCCANQYSLNQCSCTKKYCNCCNCCSQVNTCNPCNNYCPKANTCFNKCNNSQCPNCNSTCNNNVQSVMNYNLWVNPSNYSLSNSNSCPKNCSNRYYNNF
ncbi:MULTISPECIES: hypothetical protein [unclassified Romboutsia]|uniref:hypothetical protein n=1 Tax=unclassified Romboutsia TaxID=2626894 RepID=UPI000F545BEC|nr:MULTISPECIES: hypothetical protein [unclassified Romboutsia]